MDAPGMRREDLQALLRRLLRVARLDATAFLEVRDEAAATVPAVLVVAVSSLLSGIGGWLLYLSAFPAIERDGSGFFIRSVVVGTAAETVLWLCWVGIVWLMLQQVWRRQAEFLPLVRTMGLAFFPVSLSLFMVIRALATPIGIISLAAAVLLSGVAVEASVTATSDAEPSEILLSNLAGFAVFAIVLGLLGHFGPFYAPGLFAFSI